MEMRIQFSVAAVGLAIWMFAATQASADSCYDLWYKRNAIYAENGYCFKTQLGRDTFGNEGCFTRNPKLSKYEARDVKEIKQEEKKRGCKVN
jgi:YARHG domain